MHASVWIPYVPGQSIVMATMNISLPDGLKKHVREKTERGGFSNASDYVRSLIRADIASGDIDLESLLLASLDSRFSTDTPERRAEFRRNLQKRAEAKRGGKKAARKGA